MASRVAAAALLTLALALGLSLLGLRMTARRPSDEETARTLLATGNAAEAEAIEARVLQRDPTVPRVLAFVDAHRRAAAARTLYETKPEDAKAPPGRPMSEKDVAAIVGSLPPDVARVGRFALGSPDARDELIAAARGEPPVPWANHVLGVAARAAGEDLDAAELFWREGTAFPERSADLDEAFDCWRDVGAWELASDKLQTIDPKRVSPDVRYELAVHERDWRAAVRVLPVLYRARLDLRLLWLAAVAALAWGFFSARLGQIGQRPRFRAPIYLAAFALGVLSVAPTLFLVAFEQARLHLVETGDVARDLIFFVFGVGLREEGSKLLLFAPLLPLLRRYGTKLDVLVAGAFVGLGFAAEENLGYLADKDLRTGLARFLTANFLHMAMTGILASALDDFLSDGEKHAQDFLRASLLVVGLHGAYDFLIAHAALGGGYAAMGVFVLLTKLFVDRVEAARRRPERVFGPLESFVVALAAVTGASLAHAIHAVGPAQGVAVMAEGLLGEAIMVIVFARFLARI